MIIDTSTIIFVLLGAIILLICWIIRLEIRLNRLLRGKNATSLEDTITGAIENIKDLYKFREESILYLKNIEARLKRSIQAIETVRFNPFKGTGDGGNQSFSTAFMNEKGDGVVFSSLYSRDRVSVFSKPIKKFSSEFETSEEEKDVIAKAKASVAIPGEK